MKVKKRMKMIPPCYRKRGPKNTSNYSLSQLLEIGSFKKRINDLKMNNRLLTNALQESRIEAAFQSNLLKDYAKDTNQILFARIKINEMVKNLAKFATDLEEVRNCLDINFPADCTFFQKKGSTNERISKVPDVSCVEEEPELFKNEVSNELRENSPDVFESNLDRNVASVNHDIEITPILFVDDDQEIKKKRSSSVDKGSLTPQLNVDLVGFKQKRSTRSRGKTSSFGKNRSTSRGLVTQINAVSTPQMPQLQDPTEMSEILKSPSLLARKRSTSRGLITHRNVSPQQMSQVQDPVEISEVLNSPCLGRKRSKSRELITRVSAVSPVQIHQVQDPVEMNRIDFKGPFEVQKTENENVTVSFKNHSNESGHSDSSMIQISHLILNYEKSDASNIDLNQSSKIDDVVCPLQPEKNKINLPFVANLEDDSDVYKSVQEENENFVNVIFSENNTKKSTDISQNTSSTLNDIQLPEIHEYGQEIQNVGSLTFCDSDEGEDDGEKRSPVLPLVRSSRTKKPSKFTDFFLSDDDDVYSPFKLAVTKRCSSKRIKLNSTSTGKSCEISTENVDEISSDVIKEVAITDYSVYNLDVSNSEKVGKKHKKKTSAKSQSKKINVKPKPLFQKCSVVKLRGGKLEFSKCEKTAEQKFIDKQSEKSLQNSCISPLGILKRSSFVLPCEDKNHETPLKEITNADNMQDNKQQSMLQTPKRVSFAPKDLICRFEKMSESKAIADNKKVRRTSKSAIDLKELFETADRSKTPPAATGALFDIPKPGSILFDFSGDTEMYTFTLPTKIQFPVLTDDVAILKPSTPKIAENKKIKRVSKSAIDLKDSVEKTDQSNILSAATGNSSDNTDVQKPTSILFDFFADTEQIPISASDDITAKLSTSEISEQGKLVNKNKCMKKSPTILNNPKNIEKLSLKENDIADKTVSDYNSENNINNKYIEKSLTTLNSPKNIQKLSLKKNKITHKATQEYNSNVGCVSETAGAITNILLLESPMSLVNAPKRKSLFKDSPNGGSKENINTDQLVTEKKDSLKNKKSSLSTPKVGIKKSSCSKSQSKVHSKISAKKHKKSNLEIKTLEQSPVLADATNIIVESHSRRRSKQVSYKEPSLHKKLRRA